jgi:hypothetical protein
MQRPVGVDLDAYHEALASRAKPTTTVELLTAEHKPVAQVPVPLTGQVNFPGRDAEVSRTLQLDLLDPDHALELDSDSPADGAVYADRFIRVTQTIESPLLAEPASVQVFTGPLVKFSRDGDVVQVEAQGKEQRARTDVPALTCHKGEFVVDAITKIMKQRCGERSFSFPKGVRDRLPDDVVVSRVEKRQPWTVCLQLARSIGMQLFYDGRGVLVLRDVPKRPVAELLPTGPIGVEYDWTNLYNRVEVQGKPGVSGLATADAKHPLNPTKMGRFGVPWQHTLFIEDSKISTDGQADKVAEAELRRSLTQAVKVTGQTVPVWHLDPRDPVTVGDEVVSLEDCSFPLSGGDMSVGETEAVRRPHR